MDASTRSIAEMTCSKNYSAILTESNISTFYIAMDFNKVENYRFNDPELYPLTKMLEMHTGKTLVPPTFFQMHIIQIRGFRGKQTSQNRRCCNVVCKKTTTTLITTTTNKGDTKVKSFN